MTTINMAEMRAHFFDLDHTLVKGNSSFRFCCYLVRKRALSPLSLIYAIACYLRHLWLGGSLVWLHEKIFSRVLRGLSLPFLKQHVSRFVPEYLKKASNPSIMGYLQEAMAKGEYTVILSNSPGFLVSAFAEFLGVNTWRATEYATDEEFKLECIQSVLTGEEKACALKKLSSQLSLKKEQIVAYSDSFLDLPFLLFAGKVVVVGPDRQLLRVAQEKGWTIV